MKLPKVPMTTPNPLFGLYLYPEAKEFMERQQDIHWTAKEIKVEKDIQDFRVKMNADELSLVTTTLQLFVEVEQTVGDIWDEIGSWFPHSEIEGCCSAIASMEKSVHAFFYQKMSDELNIDPEETLAIQQHVEVFKNKLDLIKHILKDAKKDKLLTLATVALLEQVLLFSNFAMLKSFQSNGHNLIPNTISGVDYVINDEVIHGDYSTYLFKTFLNELNLSTTDRRALAKDIGDVVETIIEHEDAVIDHLFASEDLYINGINNYQLKQFIRHRANFVSTELGYENIYVIEDNKIQKWFYKGANSMKMHDFFVKGTNSYKRTWSEDSFSRLEVMDD